MYISTRYIHENIKAIIKNCWISWEDWEEWKSLQAERKLIFSPSARSESGSGDLVWNASCVDFSGCTRWAFGCSILRGRSGSTTNLLGEVVPGSLSSLGASGIFPFIWAETGVDILSVNSHVHAMFAFYFLVIISVSCFCQKQKWIMIFNKTPIPWRISLSALL